MVMMNFALSPNPLSISFSSPLCLTCLKRHAKPKFFASLKQSKTTVKEPTFISPSESLRRTGEELSGKMYKSLIRNYCRAGNVDGVMTLLTQLNGLGFHTSFVSYGSLIEALGNVGRTLEADCLFQEMRHFGFKPGIKLCNVLLKGRLKKGLLEMSFKFFKRPLSKTWLS